MKHLTAALSCEPIRDDADAEKVLLRAHQRLDGLKAVKDRALSRRHLSEVEKLALGLAAGSVWNAKPQVVGLPGARKLDLLTGRETAQRMEDFISQRLGSGPCAAGDARVEWADFLEASVATTQDGTRFADADHRSLAPERFAAR